MNANDRAARALAPPRNEGLCDVPCFKEGLVARLKARLPAEVALEEARAVFSALADKTRLRLLHVLGTGEELCVCDVAHVLGMSVSAASHHLRKLHQSRILKHRNDGKMAYYSLRDRFAAELVAQALNQAQRS
ncbi:MAG: ArsR/SmtB family transcription factor [Deltaproteobacteria bacterium]